MNHSPALPLFQNHPRNFQANRYVYPVLSRRAGGISIGVNLNPDKVCNFHCVYCQVDRTIPGVKGPIEPARLAGELDQMIELVVSGEIFATQFRDAPPALRRLNDIALSGDGEPTTSAWFGEAVGICAEARRRHRLDDVKLVLISNASMFHCDGVQQALSVLDANNGEIWAKLDAGSEDYYRQIAASNVPWQRVLDNLLAAARVRPIVIQSLFLRVHGQPPSAREIEAYCQRLRAITAAGGRIKLVQIHTIARRPAEDWAAALADEEVDSLAALVRNRTGLPVAAFHGSG
ncbi:MAG: radical SAM protein [Thermoguttaceae bacterium]|jgi:wyosine [tRNA(Phe)-imidazoG37] synthetase (radical SAM superfamily)